MQKVAIFLREVQAEIFKVNWPTRQDILRLSGIVIAVSAAVAGILGTLDSFFGFLFKKIILGI